MNVKQTALEVLNSMPEDITFDTLDEFLYERWSVELGRDDFAIGKVRPQAAVAKELSRSVPTVDQNASGRRRQVKWAEHAVTKLLESTQQWAKFSPEALAAFSSAVLAAADGLADCLPPPYSLPEMGDPSILEAHVRTRNVRYRVIYDVTETTIRILDFTDNTTCYRNGNPWPEVT